MKQLARVRIAIVLARAFFAFGTAPLRAQAAPPPTAAAQNPSPMSESTRAHERLVQRALRGTVRSFAGPDGKPVELYIPANMSGQRSFPLVLHFHGAAWVAHRAAEDLGNHTVCAVLNLGTGSGVYDRAFRMPGALDSLVESIAREVALVTTTRAVAERVTLTGWSAGHGAIRAILRQPNGATGIYAVMLLDGMHTSYIPEATPLAAGGMIDSTNLTALTDFARAAVRGEKRMLVTHSEIFPGTFVSTTETADWMLQSLGLSRQHVLKWGPRGLQQLSEVRTGHFELMGFAGNSAPDHVDQLHAMPELLKRLLK